MAARPYVGAVSNAPAPAKAFVVATSDAKVCAVLGPTNTGKTHYAIERMCGYATGMIGLPLRLLAREVYDRVVAIKGEGAVALVTGEEKIIPQAAGLFRLRRSRPCRWNGRSISWRSMKSSCAPISNAAMSSPTGCCMRAGVSRPCSLGARTFSSLFHRLLPGAEIMTRERLSQLTYSGPKKLTRLPKRTAIVAFSTEKVYAIAELIRRQRGGAAVVMGSLSPKTRNAPGSSCSRRARSTSWSPPTPSAWA